jgi:hypothetical protein
VTEKGNLGSARQRAEVGIREDQEGLHNTATYPQDQHLAVRWLAARYCLSKHVAAAIAEILDRPDLARVEIEFLRAMAGCLYASPHEALTHSEVRGLNRIWRRGEADAGGLRQ